MNPKISVLVCTYNDGPYLRKCIDSILNQSYKNFELIIVNDGSTDDSHKIILSYNDPRIKYYRKKKNYGNISKVRRFAVSKAKGKFFFFTDGDCWASKNWIDVGLKAFAKYNTDAIEGKIVYYKDGYKPTLSDKEVSNKTGNQWMTGNMAYKREVFQKFNFNPKYIGLEDRELALKILKKSEIPFVFDFVVSHQRKIRNLKIFFNETKRIQKKVMLIKEFNDIEGTKFRILNPKFLLVMIFPPLIITEFFYGRIRCWQDLKFLPFVWFKAVYMRYLIWKTAIKEGVFVI